MLRHSLLTVLLLFACSAVTIAQTSAVEEYRVRVVTNEGNTTHGILDDVTDQYLYVNYVNARAYHRSEKIPLTAIRKVVVRSNKRKTIEGAVVGAGIVSFLSVESAKKNGFRSPVIFGLNVVLAAAVGAAAGALVGRAIRPVGHKTIRPYGRTPDEIANSLRLQLEPFSLANQNNILNRMPQ